MKQFGNTLIYAGIALILLGMFFSLGGNISWFGRLPGDIRISRPGFNLYFPLTTSVLISIVLSLIFYFTRYFK